MTTRSTLNACNFKTKFYKSSMEATEEKIYLQNLQKSLYGS